MSKNVIRGLVASGFQHLQVEETIPRRLLLQGPNGSGKTARLRAIRLGVLGTASKDGLQPWATGSVAEVGVVCENGFAVTRRTTVKNTADGGISVSNTSACEPSLGEKTAATVDARVEREIAPNVIALDLEALWKLSGKERRRALLSALGTAGASPTWATARDMLDKALAENAAWPALRSVAGDRFAPTTDALEYLAVVESAAKAAASRARDAKDAAVARQRTVVSAPTTSVDTLRERLKTANADVASLTAAQASASQGQSERAERTSRRLLLVSRLPTEIERATDAAGWREALVRLDADLKRGVESGTKLVMEADAAKEAAEKTLKAAQRASSQHVRASGRAEALRQLVERDEGDTACPLCQTPGLDDAALKALVAEAAKARLEAKRKSDDAAKAYDAAVVAQRAADDRLKSARERHTGLKAARTFVEELVTVQERLDALQGEVAQAADAGALVAAMDRVVVVQDELEAASKAEGERKAAEDARTEADAAEQRTRDAVAVQRVAGPGGVAGTLLRDTVGALERRMVALWNALPAARGEQREGRLTIRLQDDRGEPDAELCLVTSAGTVRRLSLSGGELVYATAVLVVALAEAKPERQSIALIDAGEVDEVRLAGLLCALGPSTVDVVVVATWWGGFTENAAGRWCGFDVRRLG